MAFFDDRSWEQVAVVTGKSYASRPQAMVAMCGAPARARATCPGVLLLNDGLMDDGVHRDVGPGMTTADRHTWCEKNLPALLAGILTPALEKEVRSHADQCATCEALATALRESIDARVDRVDGHIPAGVLGRWGAFRGELRGLERALVRHHLARCTACRKDLEQLGQAPVLEVIPELELGFDLDLEKVAPKRAPTPAAPARSRPARGIPQLSGWEWLSGLDAFIAPALQLHVTRGEAVANTLEIDREARAVALRLPLPPDAEPHAPIRVEAGLPRRTSHPPPELRLEGSRPASARSILANHGEPLATGVYRLRIESEVAGAFALETTFMLKRSSGDCKKRRSRGFGSQTSCLRRRSSIGFTTVNALPWRWQ